MLITLPYFLLGINKARRQSKQIKKDPNIVPEESRYYWTQKRAKYLLWLCNVKIVAHDIENWVDGPCLMAGNHQTNYDPIVLFALNNFNQFAPIAFIGKKELLETKIISKFAQLIDCIFFDRSNMRDALRVLKEANVLIRIPRSLVLFPEGTRSKSSTLGDYKPSFFKVAQQAHAPIVPFTITNAYKINRLGYRHNYVHIFFHPALKPQTFLNRPTVAIANQIKTINEKTLAQYSGIDHKESARMYRIWKKLRSKRKKGK